VKGGEAKRILSRIARAGDNTAKIRAVEQLAKIEQTERVANKLEDTGDPIETAREIICTIPTYGPVLAVGLWVVACDGISAFPFLREVAPLLASRFPEEWARWRGHRPNPDLDAMAVGPLLSPDELVAALKSTAPRMNGAVRRVEAETETETEQEAAADAA
jgi:hypothetical protein